MVPNYSAFDHLVHGSRGFIPSYTGNLGAWVAQYFFQSTCFGSKVLSDQKLLSKMIMMVITIISSLIFIQ